jgi:hypothetical protein
VGVSVGVSVSQGYRCAYNDDSPRLPGGALVLGSADGEGPEEVPPVHQKGCVGPMGGSGRGAIFCSSSFLARLLHMKQALFTTHVLKHACMIHTIALTPM